MSSVTHIIFDLDGTLIDSSEGVVAAVNYSLEQLGEPIQPPEKIKPFIGFPLYVMYPHFTSKPIDELYAHFQVKAKETVVSSTVVLDEVDKSLTALSDAGYTMAIASTKIRPHIGGIIEKFNWQDMFACYTGGDEVAEVKPAPDIFVESLRRLNVSPKQAIVVGDTINDIKAAKAVPLPVVEVRSPYGQPNGSEESMPADYHIDKLTALLPLLKTI